MKRHFHVDEETRDTMKIIDFIDKTDLQNRSECEKAKLEEVVQLAHIDWIFEANWNQTVLKLLNRFV